MDKEKEIEEMAIVMCAGNAPNTAFVYDLREARVYARNLCGAGYRKADEVRKETVEEVIEEAKYESAMTFENKIHVKVCKMLDRVLQRYGVEGKYANT